MSLATAPFPSIDEMRRIWSGDLSGYLPTRPTVRGFHDEALFEPACPPGHWAFSRLRFLVTLQTVLSLPGTDCFDVAAGPCYLALALASAGRKVTVNDIRPLDEALTPWRGGEGMRRLTGDIFSHTPERTGRFDVVICSEVIEHVAHPDVLLAHLRGFLKPGGRLVVTTPNGSFLGSRLPTFSQIRNLDDLEKRQFQPDADGHLFLMTPEELRGLFSLAGYAIEKTLLFGSPAVTGHLKARHFSFVRAPSFWYGLERILARAPAAARARLSAHLLVCGRAA